MTIELVVSHGTGGLQLFITRFIKVVSNEVHLASNILENVQSTELNINYSSIFSLSIRGMRTLEDRTSVKPLALKKL